MNEYIVYAPSPLVRFGIMLSKGIISPDKILRTEEELRLALKH